MKMGFSPLLALLDRIEAEGHRRLAVIGIPCQVHALRALDEHQLDDIGITKAEADAEARRPFWDAPVSWFK